MAQPLINGRAYDFTQVTLIIGGVSFSGVSAISWITEQTKENNHGLGKNPVSRGHGPKNTTGSIDFSMNEVEALRLAVDSGDLTDIPMFDILVYYGNIQNPTKHVIKNAEFTSDGMEGSTGDTDLVRSFDYVASHVDPR